MTLRDEVKKMARANPELRPHLIPLLKKQGMRIPEARAIEKLRQMTDQNLHTEAVLELAKMVGNRKYIKAAEGIRMIHDGFRSLDVDVIKFRSKLLKMILKQAELWGKEVADELRGAF